jgi:hypothetical protein
MNLPRQATFHERIEAVINCGVGDLRHRFLRTTEDFFRRGMIALVKQHVINAPTLGREAETARRQPLAQLAFKLVALYLSHPKKHSSEQEVRVNVWNYSK